MANSNQSIKQVVVALRLTTASLISAPSWAVIPENSRKLIACWSFPTRIVLLARQKSHKDG
jgi:hypothetical protein